MEESFNRISKPRTAQLVSAASETWLKTKIAHLSPRSVIIERANLKHINPYFRKMLLCDVAADDIARYQAERLERGAAPCVQSCVRIAFGHQYNPKCECFERPRT